MRTILNKVPISIVMISIADGMLNISAAMIFNISGPFMKDIIKTSAIYIGFLEGGVELISWMVRLASGLLSDYLKKRKMIILSGYIAILLSRPILSSASSMYGLFLGRALDRFGKGIQASPREALLADLSPTSSRGVCFGLKHSIAIFGSILGSLLVLALLRYTPYDYRHIFLISLIPIIVSISFFFFKVHDPIQGSEIPFKLIFDSKLFEKFDWSFWKIILVCVIYMACQCSEVFIILHSINRGMPAELSPVVMVIYTFSEVLISYHIGKLSDNIGRSLCALFALVNLNLANLVLGFADTILMLCLGCALWGIQRGIGHSILLSWVADKSPASMHGSAYGIFYFVSGISLFLTNIFSGITANHFGYEWIYLSHAILGLFSIVLWFILKI